MRGTAFIFLRIISIMEFLENIAIILLFLLGMFVILYSRVRKENERLYSQMSGLISKKHSLSAKYGRMTEQFMPFLEDYPYAPQGFRFIGSPVDGVQFEKDRIIFVEFKAGGHPMASVQKEVKELIEKGKVEFKEFRMK